MKFSRFIAVVVGGALLALPTVRPAHAAGVTEVPVTFTVQNVNRSLLPCSADGKTYHVRGWLFLPPGTTPGNATLYLHGSGNSRSFHFTAVPGYDYGTEMAKLGHASVVVDQLGYGDSDIPVGTKLCLGSEADVAAQIGAAIRSGAYAASGTAPVRFSRVALGGHSMGGAITEIVGYSFPRAFDALVLAGWTDFAGPALSAADAQGQMTAITAVARLLVTPCATGGEPKRAGAPNGYGYAFRGNELGNGIMVNVDPDVLRSFISTYERDACGNVSSIVTSVVTGHALASRIVTPTLVLLGQHDVFSPTDGDIFRARLTGTKDVSLEIAANTGHGLWLERTAPAVRATLHQWLVARGF